VTSNPNDGLDLRFNFTVKDADGDAADGFFKVTVLDDGPSAGTGSVTVDETTAYDTLLPYNDGVWATATTGIPLSASGQIAFNYGMDGAGSLALVSGPTALKHHGQSVTVTIANNVATGKLADGTLVFTFTLAGDGSYVYKQYASLDHANTTNPDDVLNLKFNVRVSDFDGDTATAAITVAVRDDGPTAQNEELCFDQSLYADDGNPLTPIIYVNGVLDTNFGRDGKGSVSLGSWMSETMYSHGNLVLITTSATSVTGRLASGETIFTLTVDASGAYDYKQYAVIEACNCGTTAIKVGYVVTDADRDTASGVINFTLLAGSTPDAPPSIDVTVNHNYVGGRFVSDLTVYVSDPDSALLSGASVKLSGLAGDQLNLGNGYTVSAGNVLLNGVDTGLDFARTGDGGFTLSGAGTLTSYQSVLDSVQLDVTTQGTTSRTITFQVTDDTGLMSGTATVNMYPTHVAAGAQSLSLFSLGDDEPVLGVIGDGGTADRQSVDTVLTIAPKSGESLDLSDVLEANCQSYEDLSRFVRVDTVEGNTVVSLDETGTGQHFTEIAVFAGVTGVTLDSMIADGSLEVGRFQS